jgi:hypothetical protein
MRRGPFAIALVTVVLIGIVGVGGVHLRAVAQDATPSAGSVGITGATIGSVAPIAAPGYSLEMYWMEWAPGAYITAHTHPMAFVTCVETGALGFTILAGAATLTRAATPGESEQLDLNVEAVLGPKDCVAVDNEAAGTIHTARNASDGPTVAWEADLFKIGEPPTTFVNEQGTPVP